MIKISREVFLTLGIASVALGIYLAAIIVDFSYPLGMSIAIASGILGVFIFNYKN